MVIAPETVIVSVKTINCNNLSQSKNFSVAIGDRHWYNFVISYHNDEIFGQLLSQHKSIPPPGKATVCVAIIPRMEGKQFNVFIDENIILQNITSNNSKCAVINAGHFTMKIEWLDSSIIFASRNVVFGNRGVYTIVLTDSKDKKSNFSLVVYKDLEPKTVSMFWQIPQYVVITSGEILFSITGKLFFCFGIIFAGCGNY